MWSFHDNVLSMINPKNLVLLILVIVVLEAIICIFISLCFLVNCKKCVLLQFSFKRFLWKQLIALVITELILFFNSSGAEKQSNDWSKLVVGYK
jgi:hypothetical protein